MITANMRKRAMRIYKAETGVRPVTVNTKHTVKIGTTRYVVASDGSYRRMRP